MSGPSSEPPVQGKRIELGDGSVAWWPCHIGSESMIGKECSIGALAHIGRGATIGDGCRIQGGAYIADNSIIGSGVFIGPNATILNDRHPPSGDSRLWKPVSICDEVVIGGGSTVVAGVVIGRGAVIAAGATATSDVPADEVWGGVPATYLMSRQEYEARRTGDG